MPKSETIETKDVSNLSDHGGGRIIGDHNVGVESGLAENVRVGLPHQPGGCPYIGPRFVAVILKKKVKISQLKDEISKSS